MVIYVYDANAILTAGLKDRTGTLLVTAYENIYQYLEKKGFKPQVHWLDNECPDGIKEYNINKDTTYQLVPPNIHHCNAAEHVH
jgi:hypothetical protein